MTARCGSRWAVAVVGLVILTSCGGDDDAADRPAGQEPTGEEPAGEEPAGEEPVASAPAGVDPAATGPVDEEPVATGPVDEEPVATEPADGGTGALTASDAAERCRAMFSDTEIDELMQEPWELDASSMDSIGQTVCSWATLDEAADDFAGIVFTVQLYSGDPISATDFFDPDIYPDAVMIDGIGDLAFSAGTNGTDFNFVDGDVGGSVSYAEIDFGGGSLAHHEPAEIEALFREFYDRVT